MSLFRFAAPLLAACLLATPALAHDYKAGDLQIGHPWARPTAGKVGGAFLAIANTGTQTDRLLGGSSPAADKVELHQTIRDGDVMRMRPVDTIPVVPGEPVALKPGGLHIMLIGLKAPLKVGDKVPLTLKFERAGDVQVDLLVQAGGGEAHSH